MSRQRQQTASTRRYLEGKEATEQMYSQQYRNLSEISGPQNERPKASSKNEPIDPNKHRNECESKPDEAKCTATGSVNDPSTGKRTQKCKWKYSRCFYNLDLEDVFEKKKEKVNSEVIEFVFNKTNLQKDLEKIIIKLKSEAPGVPGVPGVPGESSVPFKNQSQDNSSQVSTIQSEEPPAELTNTIVDIFVLGFPNNSQASINNGKYYFENDAYKNYQQSSTDIPSTKILTFDVNENIKQEILYIIKGVDESQLRDSLNKSNKIILFYNNLNQVTGFILLPSLENIFDNNLSVYELVNVAENTYRLNPNVMFSSSVLSVYYKLVFQTNSSFQTFIQGAINKEKFKNAGIDLNFIIIFEELIKKILESSGADISFYLNFILNNIEFYKQELLNDPQLSILYTIKQEYCDTKETLTNAQSVLDTLICFTYFINEKIEGLDLFENVKISSSDEDELEQKMVLLYDLVYNLISLRDFVIINGELLKMLILVPKPELEKAVEQLKINETIGEEKIEKENKMEDTELKNETDKAKEFILTHEKTIAEEKIFETQVAEYEKQIQAQEKEKQFQLQQQLEDEKSKHEAKLAEAELGPTRQEIQPTLEEFSTELGSILGKITNLQIEVVEPEEDDTEEDDDETKSGFLNKLYSSGTSIIMSIITYLTEYFESFQRLSSEVLSSASGTFDIKKLLDKFLSGSAGIKDNILYYINKFSEALGGAFSSIVNFMFRTILPSTFTFLFDVLMFCFNPIKYLFTVIIPYLFSMINIDFPWRTVEYLFTSIISICKTIINNLLNLLYYIFISPVPKVLNMIMEYFVILYSKFSIFILSLGTMSQSRFLSLLPVFEYWGIQSNLIISSIGESIGNTIINSAKYGGNVSLAVIEYTGNSALAGTTYAAKAIGNAILSGLKKVSDAAIQSTIASLQLMAELIPTFSCILYNGLIYFVRGTTEIAITSGTYGCIVVKEMSGVLALTVVSASSSAVSSALTKTTEVYNFTTGTIVPSMVKTGVNTGVYLGHAAISGSQVLGNAAISGSQAAAAQLIPLLSSGGQILTNASITALDFGFTQVKLGGKLVNLTLVNMGNFGYLYVLPLAGKGIKILGSSIKSIMNFLTSQIYILCINLLGLIPSVYNITLQSGVICLKFSVSMFGLLIQSLAKISSIIITSIATKVKTKLNIGLSDKTRITTQENAVVRGAEKLTNLLMEGVSLVSKLKATESCPSKRPYFCSIKSELRSSQRGRANPCVESRNDCNFSWETLNLQKNSGTVSSRCSLIGTGDKCDDTEETGDDDTEEKAKKIACKINLNGNNVFCPKGSQFRVNPNGSNSRGNTNPCVKKNTDCGLPWEVVNLGVNYGAVSSGQFTVSGGKIKKTKKTKNFKRIYKITKKYRKHRKTIRKRKNFKKNVTHRKRKNFKRM
jgi:hypothetical protein